MNTDVQTHPEKINTQTKASRVGSKLSGERVTDSTRTQKGIFIVCICARECTCAVEVKGATCWN